MNTLNHPWFGERDTGLPTSDDVIWKRAHASY